MSIKPNYVRTNSGEPCTHVQVTHSITIRDIAIMCLSSNHVLDRDHKETWTYEKVRPMSSGTVQKTGTARIPQTKKQVEEAVRSHLEYDGFPHLVDLDPGYIDGMVERLLDLMPEYRQDD